MRVRTIVIECCRVARWSSGAGPYSLRLGRPRSTVRSATMNLTGTYPSVVSCTGEDTINYRTYRAGGPWTGPQTEVAPDPADYALSGALSFTNIVWTINLNTQRGVYRATASPHNGWRGGVHGAIDAHHAGGTGAQGEPERLRPRLAVSALRARRRHGGAARRRLPARERPVQTRSRQCPR